MSLRHASCGSDPSSRNENAVTTIAPATATAKTLCTLCENLHTHFSEIADYFHLHT